MTAAWSDRVVLHVELDVAGSGLDWAAGDAVGVLPANDPALVEGLLQHLGLEGGTVLDVAPAEGALCVTCAAPRLASVRMAGGLA